MDDEIMLPEQVADFLKIKKQTLAKWRLTGGGPPYLQVGRAIRYSRRDMKEWLETCQRSNTSQAR